MNATLALIGTPILVVISAAVGAAVFYLVLRNNPRIKANVDAETVKLKDRVNALEAKLGIK